MELGTLQPASSCSPQTMSYSQSYLADISLDGLTEGFTAFGGGADVTPGSAFASPANHSYADFDMSSTHSHIGTVSPVDLVNDQFFSAPNSTAFTDLTSPSVFNESPDFAGSVDTSPLWGAEPLDAANWVPLFGPTEQFPSLTVPPAAPAEAPASPAEVEGSPAATSKAARSSARRKSSAVSSPSRPMSATAGVSSRRRTKPLPPIEIKDKNDEVAMKRAKNTLAARRSRDRKANRLEELESKARDLEAELKNVRAERDHWKSLALANGEQ